MKILSLVFLLLFIFQWQVRAQKNNENIKEISRYRWDVGTDLLWLIDRNTIPPSVFVRLNTKKNGNLAAYRLRVGGDYSEHLNTSDTIQTTLTKTDLNLFLSAGKEWQEQFNQFQVFYGADFFYNLNYNVLEYSQNKKGFFPREKTTSIGISPFFGFRIFLHSRISISTEAHLNIFYYEFLRKNSSLDINDPMNSSILSHREYYIKMNINPLYVLTTSFHF